MTYDPKLRRSRADHQDEIRFPNLFLHPPRPAFNRRKEILIDSAIDTFLSEAVGEHQHAIFVLRGIVAVTDEN